METAAAATELRIAYSPTRDVADSSDTAVTISRTVGDDRHDG